MRTALGLLAAIAITPLLCSVAEAQMTVFRPSYGPTVISPPTPIAVVAVNPTTVYRPAMVPVPYGPPVAHTPYGANYGVPRSVVVAQTTFVQPIRPFYPPQSVVLARPLIAHVAPAPVPVLASVVVPPSLTRPAVVAPGIGGLPNVYVPGQPVRNVLRYALP